MWRILLVGILGLVLLSGCGDNNSESAAEKPFELSDLDTLPVGIEVSHSPNPVFPVEGGDSGYKYTWQYKTSLRAIDGPVTIEYFGSLADVNGQWALINYTHELFGPKEFSDWYSCPDGRISEDTEIFDPSNWGGNDCLSDGKIRWFFVGRDDKGNQVKGEAIIEQRAQLVN